jgi:hypothetical protein
VRGDTEEAGSAVAAPDTCPIDLPTRLPDEPPANVAPPTRPTGISQVTVISLPAQGRGLREHDGAVPPSRLSWGLPLGAALHPQPRPVSPDGLGQALLPDPPRPWGPDSSPAVQQLTSPRWVPPAPGSSPVAVRTHMRPAIGWVDGDTGLRLRFGFDAEPVAFLGAPPPGQDETAGGRRAPGIRRGDLSPAASEVMVVPRPNCASRARGPLVGVALVAVALALVCGAASVLVGWSEGVLRTAAPVAGGAVRAGGSAPRSGVAVVPRHGVRTSPTHTGASAIAVYPVRPDLAAVGTSPSADASPPVAGEATGPAGSTLPQPLPTAPTSTAPAPGPVAATSMPAPVEPTAAMASAKASAG